MRKLNSGFKNNNSFVRARTDKRSCVFGGALKPLACALLALTCLSCTEESPVEQGTEEGIDREVEMFITINQGIYGQVTTYDDVGPGPLEYVEGFGLHVYLTEPSLDPGDFSGAVLEIRSIENGFFEIDLAAGNYYVCTTFKRCVVVEQREGELLRLDYEFSVGPGWLYPRSYENVYSWPFDINRL